jgi:starch synthase
MKVLHISAECYPAAKAGGMGDVVGALPKYLSKIGCPAGVLIPKYHTKWIANHRFHTVYKGIVRLHNQVIPFSIQQESDNSTGFPLFVADIPGKFDRPGIYADPEGHTYGDEVSRYLCFQQAVLQWILHSPGQPGLIHCHDHHTGLVPFMLKHCPEYKDISNIPTVFTIHNGAYHGAFGWDKMYLLPFFYAESKGLLDWQNTINPLATAIKCAWRVTTVSPSYLEELKHQSNGMEGLLQHEQHKCLGVINGIDNQVWNPKTDQFIAAPWERSLADFKMVNKRVIGHRFNLDLNLPTRYVHRAIGRRERGRLASRLDRPGTK